MRTYKEQSKASIQRDFEKPLRTPNVKRIKSISQNSLYYSVRHLLVGKQVRTLDRPTFSGRWIEFIHDADRKVLNKAKEWSDAKREYLIDGVKFK